MITSMGSYCSVYRLTAFHQSQAEHSKQDYDVIRQVDIKKENNNYVSSQQVGQSSAVVEQDLDSKYQGLDAAYDATHQNNKPLDNGKRRTKDTYEDTFRGSEGIKSESSGFHNPHYNLPLQRKMSKKYAEIGENKGSFLSSNNQVSSNKFQGLQQPANTAGILEARKDQGIKETLFPDKQNSPNHYKITHKVGGSSWKPIPGHNVPDSFPSQYKIMIPSPLRSKEATHERPEPHSQDFDSKWNEHSNEDTGNKHFRQSNTDSGARNHAATEREELKDEPLHITLYSSVGDTQALLHSNSNSIYNPKQNFTASKHSPSDNDTYNKDKFDAHKIMQERFYNRFSKMVFNTKEGSRKSANSENMHNKISYPDNTVIHQETDLSDYSGNEERGIQETLADNEEIEHNLYDTIYDQQNPSQFADMPQDSKDEEESDDNSQLYDKYAGDESYDTKYGYASKTQETLKSDGSNIGQQKQTDLSKVLYTSKIKDVKRCSECDSSSLSGENWAEDNRETRNIIRSRIENLKDRIKTKMVSYMDQN